MEVKYNVETPYVIINYKQNDYKLKENYALFDLDHTLIRPLRLAYIFYNSNPNDWMYLYPQVKNKIISYSKTHNIVIITNQKGLIKSDNLTNKYFVWLEKMKLVLKDLDVPIKLFASLKDDKYRKPNTGCIDILNIKLNKNSFYCGDALGRNMIDFKDHSDTDLKFALNLNIKIYSPEYIFLDNKNYIGNINYPKFPEKTILDFKYKIGEKEMIILVGPPASGKSSISKKLVKEYYKNNYSFIDIVNQDELKTVKKCIDKTKNILNKNGSIIIDKTNPKKEDREIYIKLAKQYNYKVTCIDIVGEKGCLAADTILLHNNYYRSIKNNISMIPHVVYNIYFKNYKKPKLEEGFDKIIEVKPMIPYNDLDYFKYYF
jgi:bifunctional polynucleotide phosphatase/kinase